MVEKVLNQEQIDAMVRAARGGKTESQGKSVSAWDARQAGQIGREQMKVINSLHETFARSLTHSLGAYLRVEVTVALVSAEHLTYGEFLQRIPETTYLASLNLTPMNETAVLQLDLPVAFPLIDVLLGGEGKGSAPNRNVSEIEEQILETLMNILCRELESAWQDLALKFIFDQRQSAEQIGRLMPFEEKTLTLSFEVTIAETKGTLILMVPGVVSNAMLRKISAGWPPPRRVPRHITIRTNGYASCCLIVHFRLRLKWSRQPFHFVSSRSLAPAEFSSCNAELKIRRR